MRKKTPWCVALVAFSLSCTETEQGKPTKDGGERGETEAADKGSATAPNVKPKRARSGKFGRQRDQLDEAVWGDELAAQDYEGAFIHLWDEMRAAADPADVLLAFEFGDIRMGTPTQQALGLEHGANRASLTNTDKPLTAEEFRTVGAALRTSGWKLVESEWHHSAFEPPEAGTPAKSKVSYLLHAKNADERAFVKGVLDIEWTAERDNRGNFVPASITVTDTKVETRPGGVAFEKAQTLEPRPSKSPDPHVQPVLVEDLDGDGLSEIVLAGAKAIYKNVSTPGSIKFEALRTPLSVRGYVSAAALGDVDGDGVVDMVVGISGGDAGILRGLGDGGFSDTFEPIKLPEPLLNPFNITLGDIDGDGDLDGYVTQYKRPYVKGQMPTPYYDANDGFPAFLIVNDGKGGFTDGTEAAGLTEKRLRRSYASSFMDLDSDGDLDLLVTSDFSGVDVFENDGKGKFTDITAKAIDERASFGMSHTVGDYDGDGNLDLYVVGMSSTTARRLEGLGLGRDEFAEHQEMRMKMAYGNRMYAGQGDGTYREVPWSQGTARSGWSWGSTSFDFDNDGDLDIYVANGFLSRGSAQDYCTTFWTHDIYTGNSELDPELNQFFAEEFDDVIANNVSWNGYEHNKLYVNSVAPRGHAPPEDGAEPTGKGLHDQKGIFTEMGWLLGVALEEDSRAVVSDDLDGDGRLDLIVGVGRVRAGEVKGEAFEQKVHVLRNVLEGDHHWFGVRFAGKRSPIGARVVLKTATGSQERRVLVGDSLQGQHSTTQHFGLGELDAVESIVVTYSDGKSKTIRKPKVDGYVVVN